MNRNHQSQNTMNHTGRGRQHLARKQMGSGMHTPMKYNPKESDRRTEVFTQSNFNKPEPFNRNETPYQNWISSTEDTNYDNYRSDGPGPVEIEAREKYRHEDSYGIANDFHGREFSYRAQSEMNYEGIGPKGYLRSDDSILDEVCRMLSDSDDIDASDLSVDVEEGVVKLSGQVNGRQSKFAIEDLVESVSGVKEIQNNIKVQK